MKSIQNKVQIFFLLQVLFTDVSVGKVLNEATSNNVGLFKFDESTILSLNSLAGQWEYYPGELLEPEKLTSGPNPNAKYIQIPYFETDYTESKQATLRAFVKFPNVLKRHSISSGLAYSSNKIWVNRLLLGELGNISEKLMDRKSWVDQKVFPLHIGKEFEVVIQISNVDQYFFGLYKPPKIGPTELISNSFFKEDIPNFIVLGLSCAMFAYCLISFLMDPKQLINKWVLFLGFSILFRTFFRLPISNISEILQIESYSLLYSLSFLTYYLMAIGTYFTIRYAAPRLLWKKWSPIISTIFVVLSLRLFLTTPKNYYQDVIVMHILMLLMTGNAFHSIFFKSAISLKMRNELKISVFVLASSGVPAIILHFLANDFAVFSENFLYFGFVLIFGFLKSKHQIESYNKIKIEIRKRRHAYTQMVKMIYPHQLEQIKQGKDLESTMPTGTKTECCVMCFDIVNSSALPHTEAKNILAEILGKCNDAMVQNYEPKNLVANAYRINEVGDGFYCSIGFPFSSNLSPQPEIAAYLLAEKFTEIVDQVSERRMLSQALHCAIGIANGTLHGFFTTQGIKRYEMYGESIVLANRYEAMRKFLFSEKPLKQHIWIFQDKVVEKLPSTISDHLQKVNLNETSSLVRNDPNARVLYYKLSNQGEVITLKRAI